MKNIVVASDDAQTLKDVTARLKEALDDFRAAKSDYNDTIIYKMAMEKRQEGVDERERWKELTIMKKKFTPGYYTF